MCDVTRPNGTDSLWCCLYTKASVLGIESETWTCGWGVTTDSDDDTTGISDAFGADYESYCDNALLMKVSFFVAALVAFFAF